ncbi:MAG: SprT-like domain-containing protein [Flavobacteriaceae bacterium]|nr:SprT-like domain-containing protein [Flavobacteriaceae bacterium]NVJ71743.1 SprT-like domain-containing protein [Flavobacteriaceae bacterium]
MEQLLEKYLPKTAVQPVFELIKQLEVHLKIVKERRTRHGDYRRDLSGRHLITINASLNPYSFLITLIHELAHLLAYKTYGRGIKPHGKEWKHCFQHMMLPFLRPEVFPGHLLPVLAKHFKNPKASSDTDAVLSIALKQYDTRSSFIAFIYELPDGSLFKTTNNRVFKKVSKRVKRYECMELTTKKIYLFQPNAQVELIQE